MKLFGRKRHIQRQAPDRAEMNHRLGVQYGYALFQMDVPRPGFTPTEDAVEMAFRMGVQAGYTAAEMEYEDEVGWWLKEETDRGMLEIACFLREQEAT